VTETHDRTLVAQEPAAPERSKGRAAALLLGAFVALYLFLAGVGLLLTTVLFDGRDPAFDVDSVEWFEKGRTPFWDTASDFGSSLSDTAVCIAVAALAFGLLRWRLGRWHESWVVVIAITGELWLFLAVTATVVRDRPEVAQLDPAPPTSSFPSGHTAAAIALYGCLAFLLLRLADPGPVRTTLVVLLFCIPVIVAVSRVYRGMHFPSDVVFGAIGGGLWLLAVVAVLLPRERYAVGAGSSG
jgi:membrane-associated phospholipid phosphatase